MIKIIFSAIFLLALCSAHITLPFKHSSEINRESIPQPFVTTDDERNTSSPQNLKLTLTNHRNMYYYADIYIGENSTIKVLLETRTNNLWLNLWNDVWGENTGYNCSASPTCDKTEKFEELTYNLKNVQGYSQTIAGCIGHEILGLTQDFKVKSSVLWSNGGMAFDSYYRPVNGFMGLGSNESSQCFIDQAYNQNYIQEKVFSFYFDFIPRFSEDSNKSYILIGYIPENKVNNLTWLPIDSASPNSWTMSFSSVKIGDKVLNTSSDVFPNKISIDSGAPYILLPPSVLKELNSEFQNTPKMTVDGEVYIICNDNYTDSYPKITFKFDNMDLVIDANTYLSFKDVQYEAYNKRFCRFLAVTSDTLMPVLGNSFLRNYFVAFSKRNQTVGIHPEVKQIRFGNIEVRSQIPWVHISVVVGLLVVIIVICVLKSHQKKAEDLKQLLNNDDENHRNDVFYSQARN